jgi:hypothetical protein
LGRAGATLAAVDEELAISAKFEMVDFTREPRELTAMLIPIAILAAINRYSTAVLPASFLKSVMPSLALKSAPSLTVEHGYPPA